MKGKINDYGALMIDRAGELVRVYCYMDQEETVCSDTCAKFQEPISDGEYTWLQLCNGDCLTFTEFVDERK